MLKVTVNQEFEIVLPRHRAERPEWFTEKGWEKKRLQALHKRIQKGDLVYYVGSEEGEMPALCQMWGAEVILFEPNDRVWPNTKAIFEANQLDAPMGCFVGFAANITDAHAVLHLGKFPDEANGEVIPDHAFKELHNAGSIPRTKIDDIVFNLSPLAPTVISIDVEGSEWEVLKGSEKTLKKYHPTLFVSWHPEFMNRIYGYYVAEARDWLIKLGYTEHFIDYPLHEVHMMYDTNT